MSSVLKVLDLSPKNLNTERTGKSEERGEV
jgi:hypothetical protein